MPTPAAATPAAPVPGFLYWIPLQNPGSATPPAAVKLSEDDAKTKGITAVQRAFEVSPFSLGLFGVIAAAALLGVTIGKLYHRRALCRATAAELEANIQETEAFIQLEAME